MKWYEDPIYHKMCEKAWEIQELRPQVMISSVRHYYKGVYQYEVDSEGVFRYWNEHYFIWLPRQDQLQAMLAGHFIDGKPRKLVKALWDWIAETAPKPDDSREQLELAFVYKELYHKVWNGEDWVKEL